MVCWWPSKSCFYYMIIRLDGGRAIYSIAERIICADNKKNWWWKVPVIYGIGGTLLYSGIFYQNEYDNFRLAYKERIETLTNKDQIYNRYQTPTLQVIRDSYRDSRDQSYMWLVVVYALQVLDATVEAHFVDFNMNENVSLKIQPQIYMVGLNYTGGLQVTFKF